VVWPRLLFWADEIREGRDRDVDATSTPSALKRQLSLYAGGKAKKLGFPRNPGCLTAAIRKVADAINLAINYIQI
jgi:hypothetical protein